MTRLTRNFVDSLIVGDGPQPIEAVFREDLLGHLPWPVYCIDTEAGPRCWRLIRASEEASPRAEEVTDEVRRALRAALEATRGKVALAKYQKLLILSQSDNAAAPAVRHAREQVAPEITVELSATGSVVGRKSADRVQSVLRRYFRHKEITSRQFYAGLKLQDDYDLTQLAPRVTQDLTSVGMGGGSPAETIIKIRTRITEAQRQIEAAMRYLGRRLWPITHTVVCEDRPAHEWALAAKWPSAHGLPVLKIALDTLGDHYRLAG
jgi:hypothetical protein